MDLVNKQYDKIEYGTIIIEKRGEGNPVDVIGTERVRIGSKKREVRNG